MLDESWRVHRRWTLKDEQDWEGEIENNGVKIIIFKDGKPFQGESKWNVWAEQQEETSFTTLVVHVLESGGMQDWMTPGHREP